MTENTIGFVLDGNVVEVTFGSSAHLTPTTTVLNYLRSLPDHRGVKEGCAEGDCGACTVVIGELTEKKKIRYTAVDSCLVFLPMLHGKQLITIENLRDSAGDLHPAQKALVTEHGSQCGFCTPGIVMSLFALYKSIDGPTREEIADTLAGNLCRCTGYRPIIDAAAEACHEDGKDHFAQDEARIVDVLKSIPQKGLTLISGKQRYDQPSTLDECLALRERFPEAILINGATDVALRVTKKFEALPHVIDCSHIEELQTATTDERSLTLGAGLQMSDVMNIVRKDFPALYDMLSVFGARQIRNLATLGGNIGTASPIGDTLPVLIALGASIVLRSRKGTRTVAADSFVKGYRQTECRPDELITAVVLPRPAAGTLTRAYKVSKRRDLDISTVSGAFRLGLDWKGNISDIILAYGGMADRTKRAASAESYLRGKPWDRRHVEEAQKYIDKDFDPISDVRGSAQFRKIAARNLLLKFWSETNN